MRSEEKGNVKNSVGRLIFGALSFVIQTLWIVFLFVRLNEYSTIISGITTVLAFMLVFHIYGKPDNAAFKMPWIILIFMFPILGVCIYGLFGHKRATKKVRERFFDVHEKLAAYMKQDDSVIKELEMQDFGAANQFRYLSVQEGYPAYSDTDVIFYKEASDGFEAQLAALEKAESYIFMEYHAIEEAEAFERLHDVLKRKAQAGVEVRVLYDDVGSVGFVNFDFIKRMQESGIQCKVFNPVLPVLQIFMNNRDHRKITVIDGKAGFTGGYNLADEYFNLTHPYGYWKDTGVKLTGGAVKSLLAMFLEMWDSIGKENEDISVYFDNCNVVSDKKADGFIAAYADSPLDDNYVGENVYLNLIKYAKHYVYITTPYLIISDEMNRELTLAAKRGVDVRIVTPGIPDKKLIYRVTRSYYGRLASAGVKIYEYTPGFVHAKQMLADGNMAVVGTINMDYRSLYHHFENAVLMYGFEELSKLREDFEETFTVSEEVTSKYQKNRYVVLRGLDTVLRLIAPLL